MPLMTWKNDLSVNINSIDAEHKKLIALINELNEAMSSGKGKDIVGKVLNDLIEYTKTHFAHEEKLMAEHSYPGYLPHKKEHDELARQVIDFDRDLKAGKLVVTVLIMTFLKDWLTTHIKGTDQKYSPFLVRNGIS
ncbi:MAG: hemerythrin family protein [Nitrospirae bacterium]|nr:hemerythrin family protein [Nitrospirota bacterium]